LELYGAEPGKASYANSCLLARRMIERGVRFVEIFHESWDQHGDLTNGLKNNCKTTDRASAALVKDLKQRGLLDDTLVIWGGEFGRTVYSQGELTETNYGRDHHPRCFSVWMAGGGIKGGLTYGKTDDYCYNIVENPVHIRDLHATILHQLGIDNNRMTFKHQGLDEKLTGVEHAKVVKDILA
jgi:uncharacterized protein (DUF1501 family)